MRCCDEGNGKAVGECIVCWADIDENGVSVTICPYSPVLCETCGDALVMDLVKLYRRDKIEPYQ